MEQVRGETLIPGRMVVINFPESLAEITVLHNSAKSEGKQIAVWDVQIKKGVSQSVRELIISAATLEQAIEEAVKTYICGGITDFTEEHTSAGAHRNPESHTRPVSRADKDTTNGVGSSSGTGERHENGRTGDDVTNDAFTQAHDQQSPRLEAVARREVEGSASHPGWGYASASPQAHRPRTAYIWISVAGLALCGYMVVHASSNTENGTDLAVTNSPTSPKEWSMDFTLVNQLGGPIIQLNSKPSATSKWLVPGATAEVDETGRTHIPGYGGTLNVHFKNLGTEQTCLHDLLITADYDQPRQSITVNNLDLCGLDKLTLFYENGQIRYQAAKMPNTAAPAVLSTATLEMPSATQRAESSSSSNQASVQRETFQDKVKHLQQGAPGNYIEVVVPQLPGNDGYSSDNFYSESRLYADRIELRANQGLRNTKAWQLAEGGYSAIDANGVGESYHFVTLSPCSAITRSGGATKRPSYSGVWEKVNDNVAAEWTGKACLERDRIVFRMQTYAETLGSGTSKMEHMGACRRGSHGGCVLSTEDQEYKFVVLPK